MSFVRYFGDEALSRGAESVDVRWRPWAEVFPRRGPWILRVGRANSASRVGGNDGITSFRRLGTAWGERRSKSQGSRRNVKVGMLW